MSRTLVVVMLAAAGLFTAAPSHAQESARPNSIALRVGETVGFGLWRNVGPALAVGLELAASVDRLEGDDLEQEISDFTVEPAVKLYGPSGQPARSYLWGSVFYSVASETSTDTSGDETEIEVTQMGGSLGFGLEWFPIDRVSVGGHVGVRAGVRTTAFIFDDGLGDDELKADGPFFRTLASGIRVHFYF
ncbi:MAG TPA: hypothetical protein VFQ45_04980 [Longimicrobium sp.]|nr:hypothetical protein [Longimicrobium sp.]